MANMRGRKPKPGGKSEQQITLYLRDPGLKAWVVEQAENSGRSISNWLEERLEEIKEQIEQAALFRTSNGQLLKATTDHSASSYGLPVLVDEEGTAHGPAETGPVSAATDNTTRDWIESVGKAGYNVITE